MGSGGSGGELSGSDFDAIRISDTSVGNAAFLPAATVAIDFASGNFTPGTQRAPVDPDLFNVPGGVLDHVAATLDLFDAVQFPNFANFCTQKPYKFL